MGISHSPKIVTDGLVLALDAADTNSYPGTGNTWYDLSGNGNNGTLYNSPDFTGNSLIFDGINQYGLINSSQLRNIHNSGEVTYEVSFRKLTGGFVFGRSLPSGGSGYSGCQYEPSIFSSSTVALSGCGGSGRITTETLDRESTVNSLSIAFSENNNLASVYSNGEIVNTNTISYTKNNSTQSSRIFSVQYTQIHISGGWSYYGTVDRFSNNEIINIRIYNRYISQKESLQNYNATKTRFGL